MRIRGFAGLPDGSAWLVDEVAVSGDAVAGGDEVAGGHEVAGGDAVTGGDAVGGGDGVPVRDDGFEAAGRALARRMLAAGARDLLRDAEAMAGR